MIIIFLLVSGYASALMEFYETHKHQSKGDGTYSWARSFAYPGNGKLLSEYVADASEDDSSDEDENKTENNKEVTDENITSQQDQKQSSSIVSDPIGESSSYELNESAENSSQEASVENQKSDVINESSSTATRVECPSDLNTESSIQVLPYYDDSSK